MNRLVVTPLAAGDLDESPFIRRTREPVSSCARVVVHAGTSAFGEPEIAPSMYSVSKPHSMLIDDPELPFERLSFEQGHDPLERGEYMWRVLPLASQASGFVRLGDDVELALVVKGQ